ncbi:DUF934 domain-containing protein [Microbulbifer sp. 2205BS26-8]|uniref:DUF934 domain-containing protein n=1 Tax=Microbulbifer sp. 2205BS26-8 TaxID=3064386 RepID=UPI00273F9469|nr:DUF934 domain-containing protein [Microbulbifer sp. 2205BS26-8]MDP5209038.1 DUF934 domain-containing protein [Microbulbifer sp. 2205BS26-8]
MPKPAKPGPQPGNPSELIIDGEVRPNQWRLLAQTAAGESPDIPAAGKVILPLRQWQTQRRALTARSGEIGVWLDSDEGAESIGAAATECPLIAVHFPAFADGRGFTTGRLLRERFGFKGELRAVGGFMRDQLTYLRRCGFNAYAFEGDEPLASLHDSLHDFSDSYQAGVDQPLPLFRRRL